MATRNKKKTQAVSFGMNSAALASVYTINAVQMKIFHRKFAVQMEIFRRKRRFTVSMRNAPQLPTMKSLGIITLDTRNSYQAE